MYVHIFTDVCLYTHNLTFVLTLTDLSLNAAEVARQESLRVLTWDFVAGAWGGKGLGEA